jgi:oxygen-independent coproporphyrinogen-3 oxidase
VPRRLSLYQHVPFAEQPCFHCPGTFTVEADSGKVRAHFDRLARERELAAPLFDRDRDLIQLNVGGGGRSKSIRRRWRSFSTRPHGISS